jgi:hypothetical protein
LGIQVADKMRFEMKREYCVTPANYLEVVTGFIQLLQVCITRNDLNCPKKL